MNLQTSHTSYKSPTDVLIVGGGPAGLATALAARRHGLEVHVVDRATPPLDRACGEGIMPGGVAWLERAGVVLEPAWTAPFSGIRYIQEGTCAEGLFPGRPGLGVRRTHLHERMVRRAGEAGVRLEWGVSVTGLRTGGVETDRGPRLGRWIVGADGLHSRVRRWAGLERGPGPRPRYGVRRHYTGRPWTDRVEVWWSADAEAYVTPVGPDRLGVAILWGGGDGGFDRLMHRFPALSERLARMQSCSADRGAGPLQQRVSGVVRGAIALVGDAAGFRDALTGEGLSLAFHQADALAEAVVRDDLHLYARAHRRITAPLDRLTRSLLFFQRHPGARRRLVRLLARYPALFSHFLAGMAVARPPTGLDATWHQGSPGASRPARL